MYCGCWNVHLQIIRNICLALPICTKSHIALQTFPEVTSQTTSLPVTQTTKISVTREAPRNFIRPHVAILLGHPGRGRMQIIIIIESPVHDLLFDGNSYQSPFSSYFLSKDAWPWLRPLERAKVKCEYPNRKSILDLLFDGKNSNFLSCHYFQEINCWNVHDRGLDLQKGQGQMQIC